VESAFRHGTMDARDPPEGEVARTAHRPGGRTVRKVSVRPESCGCIQSRAPFVSVEATAVRPPWGDREPAVHSKGDSA